MNDRRLRMYPIGSSVLLGGARPALLASAATISAGENVLVLVSWTRSGILQCAQENAFYFRFDQIF
jgi:hypothetical protein